MQQSRGEQFWITKPQLAALAVTTASVSVLAFFVGLMIGRKQAPPPLVVDEPSGLVSAEVEADALTELLARVEEAAASPVPEAHAEPTHLDFPQELAQEELALDLPEAPPAPELVEVILDPDPVALPLPPELAAPEPPESGWAIQVFSFQDWVEADAKVEALRELGHDAFRVDALVRGETWHRIKIGPFDSMEEATVAQGPVNEALLTWDSRVVSLP